MTNNDDFTRAAEDAADRSARTFIGNNDAAYGYSCGFTTGAEWGREQALAQEPTDAEVEAAVLGELAHLQGYDLAGEEDRVEVLAWWAGMDEEVRASRLDTARAALTASRRARAARRYEEKQDG